jgi:hypothetical protein
LAAARILSRIPAIGGAEAAVRWVAVAERTPMPDLAVTWSGETVLPGEAYLVDTPMLRAHAGTQPDLYLTWNAIPLAAARIDVAVHLHGFSRSGALMPLGEKVASSGLEPLGCGRPTLALLPRGNWLRYTWYDFPALLAGGIDRLVDDAVARFAAAAGCTAVIDRLILSAHSGGGMPAVDAIAGARRPPDQFFVFDGLYGRDPAGGDPMAGLEVVDAWLGARLALEPVRQGALRVVYIAQQTGPFSRRVQALIEARLAGLAPDLAARLRRRYRTELSFVPHAHIARRFLPLLLADPGGDLDWSR